jgi:hypothetical protein
MPPSLFALLWPLALLMDLLTFPHWLHTPLGILLAAAIFANLLFPGRTALFALLCLIDLAHVFSRSPITPNHTIFHSFVHLAFLLTLLLRCPAHFAPTVRYLTLAVYAISFFHKLNADFLHPTISCASELTLTILRRFAMAPSDFSSSIPAWATLFCESFIPLLLLFPRTIPAALLLAIAFHGVLSLVPVSGVYSFSATMLAALVLFLPAQTVTPYLRYLRPLVLLFALSLLLPLSPLWYFRLGFLAWFAIPLGLLWALRGAHTPPPLPRPSWLASTLLLLFLCNGFAPYLGLHTLRTFSMFSNLRTEGGRTNHWLIPTSLQLFPYQRQLANILETNNPALQFYADRLERLPLHELRRRLTPTTTVTYTLNGQTFHHPTTPLAPVSPWVAKWLAFRPVSPSTQAACAW